MAKMTPKQFVSEYYKHAIRTQSKKGIDARFTLAQAALESGWSESAPGNNFFGVKATKDTPENKKQLLTTTEILSDDKQAYRFPEVISITRRTDGKYLYRVKDWFRKYDSPEESFTDHANFFFQNKRYAKALEFKNDSYKFAEEIASAGYATDPNYAKSLKSVIQTIEKNMQ